MVIAQMHANLGRPWDGHAETYVNLGWQGEGYPQRSGDPVIGEAGDRKPKA